MPDLRRALPVALMMAVVAVAPPRLAAQASPPAPGAQADAPPVIETRLRIQAFAHDARFIGDRVGGARIRIREAGTGALLAEGIQRGESDSASFTTSLPLARPTLLEIAAEAPLDIPHAMRRATVTVLALPGVHVDDPGIVITLHGFVVEIVGAPDRAAPGDTVHVDARVRLLCGCPTEPGGTWNSDSYVLAVDLVAAGGRVLTSVPLTYADSTSHYRAAIPVPGDLTPGTLTLRAHARDRSALNTGMVEQAIVIGRPTPGR